MKKVKVTCTNEDCEKEFTIAYNPEDEGQQGANCTCHTCNTTFEVELLGGK